MLWQQALATGRKTLARKMAKDGIKRLREIDRDYDRYWPVRNKGTTAKSSGFLKWRMEDYRSGTLAFPPEVALNTPETKPDSDV